MMLFQIFALSLLVTVVTECTLAYLLGLRNRKDQCLVLLVNLLTNPAVVYVNLLAVMLLGVSARTVTLVLTESAAVMTEGHIYARKLDWESLPSGTAAGIMAGWSPVIRAFLFSVLLNAASYGAGELIEMLLRRM